jgi:hypothetical protein
LDLQFPFELNALRDHMSHWKAASWLGEAVSESSVWRKMMSLKFSCEELSGQQAKSGLSVKAVPDHLPLVACPFHTKIRYFRRAVKRIDNSEHACVKWWNEEKLVDTTVTCSRGGLHSHISGVNSLWRKSEISIYFSPG